MAKRRGGFWVLHGVVFMPDELVDAILVRLPWQVQAEVLAWVKGWTDRLTPGTRTAVETAILDEIEARKNDGR